MYEFRFQSHTSNILNLVWFTDLKFLNVDAMQMIGTSNPPHYHRAVIDDEWRNMINVEPAGSVEVALQDIRRAIINLARTDMPSPIISQLINDFDELQDARNIRLAVGSTSIDYYKWYLVLSLTFLTAITFAATHADRVRTGVKALAIDSLMLRSVSGFWRFMPIPIRDWSVWSLTTFHQPH